MRIIEPAKGFTNKCYKEKSKWGRATQMLDSDTHEWVTPEEFYRRMDERGKGDRYRAKGVDGWQNEWTYLSTGRRMSKGQLKEYCKRNNKVWENQ